MPEPDAPRLDRADQIMGEILDAPADQRPTILAQHVAANPEYASLLRAGLEAAGHWSLFESAQSSAARSPFPVVGGCRIEGELGRGGMGVVYAAEQLRPVRRRVAVKVIRIGLDSQRIVTRFEIERQALARMSHPNIAQVFGAGQTEDQGMPYFLMEYIEGEPIDRYCDRRALAIEDRLRLFQDVCEGVQHAHRKAVIHRDLKPSNILVTEADGAPVPKVIDFGVARALDQKLTDETFQTDAGVVVGTPEYMSPEQAGDDPAGLDTRTDVYSLGVVLFQLLVGRLPLESAELRRVPTPEWIRILREQEPAKPSTRLLESATEGEQESSARRSTARRLSRRLRGDLDWIAMKTLEKDRERRYASPAELAADIQRHLDHEPVTAGPPNRIYRLRRFARRHRAALTAVAAVFVTLVAGVVSFFVQFREARAQSRIANERFAAMTDVTQSIVMKFDGMIEDLPGALQARRYLLDKSLAFLGVMQTAVEGTQPVGIANERKAILADANLLLASVMDRGLAEDGLAQALDLANDGVALLEQVLGATSPAKRSETRERLASALTTRGYIRFHRGDHDGAERDGRRALSILEGIHSDQSHRFPTRVRVFALMLLADREELRGRPRRALEIRKQSLALTPESQNLDGDPRLAELVAVNHHHFGRTATALGEFKRAAEHLARAERMMRARCEAQPRSVQAVSRLTECLFDKAVNHAKMAEEGDQDACIETIVRILAPFVEADPENERLELRLARALYYKAGGLVKNGERAAGRACADRAASFVASLGSDAPGGALFDAANARHKYAMCLILSDDHEAALAETLEVVAMLERAAEAVGAFRARSALANAERGLATLRLLMGQHEEAAAALRDSIDTVQGLLAERPGSVYDRKTLGFAEYRLGLTLRELDRFEEAQKAALAACATWRALLREQPRSWVNRDMLVVCWWSVRSGYHRLGDEAAARQADETVLAIRKEGAMLPEPDVKDLIAYGRDMLQCGQPDLIEPAVAADVLRKASALLERPNRLAIPAYSVEGESQYLPAKAVAEGLLSEALERQGRKTDALQAARRALQHLPQTIVPGNRLRRELLRRIARLEPD